MKIITTILAALAGESREEQHQIMIGARMLQRGQVLRENAQRTQARVRIAEGACACGSNIAIGQCSCSAGMPTSFASSAGGNGNGFGSAGAYVANPPGGGIICTPGCYPRSACDPDGRFRYDDYASRLRDARIQKTPYADPYFDSIWMQSIYSAVTTVPAGTSVDIPLTPVNGTFALFYYDIVAVDPTTQVAQVDWRAGQPRVEGCPVPCGSGDVEALSQFVQKVPEACCGNPLVAWLDRPSEDTPLNVPVTNNQAAGDLLFQVRGRGYCCSTRIC